VCFLPHTHGEFNPLPLLQAVDSTRFTLSVQEQLHQAGAQTSSQVCFFPHTHGEFNPLPLLQAVDSTRFTLSVQEQLHQASAQTSSQAHIVSHTQVGQDYVYVYGCMSDKKIPAKNNVYRTGS